MPYVIAVVRIDVGETPVRRRLLQRGRHRYAASSCRRRSRCGSRSPGGQGPGWPAWSRRPGWPRRVAFDGRSRMRGTLLPGQPRPAPPRVRLLPGAPVPVRAAGLPACHGPTGVGATTRRGRRGERESCTSHAGQTLLAATLPARAADDHRIRIGLVHRQTFDIVGSPSPVRTFNGGSQNLSPDCFRAAGTSFCPAARRRFRRRWPRGCG